jgi:hypothetical protein
MQAVRFDGMLVTNRAFDFDVADLVRAAVLAQLFPARHETPQVRKDDGIAFNCVLRRKHDAARTEAALRHRFDHHVDVAGVIEMLVREDDCIEPCRLAWRHVRKRAHERARTRIDVQLRVAETPPHSARGSNLSRDDEARAAGS